MRQAKHAFWHRSPTPEDPAIQASVIHTGSTSFSLPLPLLCALAFFKFNSLFLPCLSLYFCLTWSSAVPTGAALLLEATSNFFSLKVGTFCTISLMKIVHPSRNCCNSLLGLSLQPWISRGLSRFQSAFE